MTFRSLERGLELLHLVHVDDVLKVKGDHPLFATFLVVQTFRSQIKGPFTLATVVCGFHRDRNFYISLRQRNRLL